MVIVTIGALIVGDVHAKLGRVKTALLDGPEAEYAAVSGGESVTLVISDRIPGDRLYHVWSDGHRDECFKVMGARARVFQKKSPNGVCVKITWDMYDAKREERMQKNVYFAAKISVYRGGGRGFGIVSGLVFAGNGRALHNRRTG